MNRNQRVSTNQFAMVPRSEVPRSSFKIQHTHKTTIDSGYLFPIYVDEILPGDSFKVKANFFARLSTPIVPIMDNLYLETFFFFVPNRLVWDNWVKMMGEQKQPNDSISFNVPQIVSPVAGYLQHTIYDYLGLPTAGQVAAGQTITHSALPLRAYALIYNEWFRDENLAPAFTIPTGDGPDLYTTYALQRRGKRHDYFTSCLPWPQKGASVPMPGPTGQAPVVGIGWVSSAATGAAVTARETGGGSVAYASGFSTATAGSVYVRGTTTPASAAFPQVFANLNAATQATINELRTSFQIQKLLERDARGGTRYAELIRSHFGVISPDARQQRPEYLGGGSTMVSINPVTQTSGTSDSATPYTPTPQGNLAAYGTAGLGHGWTQSFTEHGYVIGVCQIRADLSYQQGLRRMWSKKSRYDFYWPAFAHLGEQAILNKEIYANGIVAEDDAVFGYNERWSEYRYNPSIVTGAFRSNYPGGGLDVWHLSQNFTARPTLGAEFIFDKPPVSRVLAVPGPTGQEFLLDCFFNVTAARPLPMYSVPGMADHF